MGTRSLTIIKDEDGQDIICLYRQFDGYPSGHGKELADFLKSGKLVNGLPLEPKMRMFNGMGCLAAQVVAHFKGEDAGGFYLYPPDTRNVGEEYVYVVWTTKNRLYVRVESGAMTFFGLPGTKEENMNILYNGPISRFSAKKAEASKKSLPDPPNDWVDAQQAQSIA